MKATRMKKDVKVEEKGGKRVVRAKVTNLDEPVETPKPKSAPKSKADNPVRKPKELDNKKSKKDKKDKSKDVVVRKPRPERDTAHCEKCGKALTRCKCEVEKPEKSDGKGKKDVSEKWRQAGLKAAETRRRNQALREAKDDKTRKSVDDRKPKAKVEEKPQKRTPKKGTLEAQSQESWDTENLSHIWADLDHGQGFLLDALKRMKALPKSMTANYPNLTDKLNEILSDLIEQNAIVREMFKAVVLHK